MFTALETALLSFAHSMPLPLFAFVASFVEEVIAPIPSGAVLLLIGSLAQLQSYTVPALIVLALVATFGKLFGALLIYVIADKAEDVVMARFSHFLSIKHEDLEKFGERFGNGWKDYLLLTLLRALPIVPSAVVSAGAGVLRIPMRLFIFATVVGSFVRDSIFIGIGYGGFVTAALLLDNLSGYESALQIGVSIGLGLALVTYIYLRKRRTKRI